LEPLEGAYTPVRPATAANQTHITTDCENVDAALRFLFELNDVEIQRAGQFGEEGVDWEKIVDENGIERVNRINDVYNQPNNKTWSWAVPGITFSADISPYKVYQAPVDFETFSYEEQISYWRDNMLDMMVEANYPNTANNPSPLFFNAVYTTEEVEENGTLLADIKAFMKQQRGMFITGALDIDDDNAWKTYVDALDQQGLQTVLENAQAAWDRQQYYKASSPKGGGRRTPPSAHSGDHSGPETACCDDCCQEDRFRYH